MCSRYFIDDADETEEELLAILSHLNRRGIACKTGEIFPTDVVPVIANSRRLSPRPFAMKWGYTIPGGRPVINARSETMEEKPLFCDGARQRRCLIPAAHYFEWDQDKTKYAIRPKAKGMMFMAGIYRLESSGPVFTILTREPAAELAAIHHRMPVLLPRDACAAWLNLANPAEAVLQAAVTEVAFSAVS